ncbi:MAG: hypothetical protein ACI35S_01830 [Anaeroplasma sp.]
MESLQFISKLLEGRLVLGAKEELGNNISLIPVYKVKISFLNLKTDLKDSDGASGSIGVTPICLIKNTNGIVDIISLEETQRDSFKDVIPNMLNNIDINSILKNIKI